MAMMYMRRVGMFKRDAQLYLFGTAMLGLGYFGLYAALFNLFLLRLGYGPEFIGLVNGVGLLASALFGLPAGALGRRWGTRRTMIVGLFTLTVSGLLTPFAHTVPVVLRAGLLLTTSALGWLGGTLFMVNGNPFLMATTTVHERPHAFSVMTALWPFGGFLGSVLGGQLPGIAATLLGVSLESPETYGYSLLSVPLSYSCALFALMLAREPETDQAEEALKVSGRVPYGLLVALALVFALHQSSDWMGRVFLNMYLDARLAASTSLIGMVLGVGQLLSVPAALIVPLLMKRLGNRRTVMLGSLGMGCCLLPLALAPHWIAAGLGFLGAISMSSIWYPAITMYHQEVVAARWRTMASGVASTAASLAMAAISYGGGQIIGSAGYRSLFLLGMALAALAALVFWACLREPRELDADSGTAMRRT